MARQNLEGNFGKLLEDVTREGLRHASTEALAELAKQLWYGQSDLVPVLEEEVSTHLRQVDQKQRALYLVDRLRRFPCVPRDKATVLKAFVSSWSSLKLLRDRLGPVSFLLPIAWTNSPSNGGWRRMSALR